MDSIWTFLIFGVSLFLWTSMAHRIICLEARLEAYDNAFAWAHSQREAAVFVSTYADAENSDAAASPAE